MQRPQGREHGGKHDRRDHELANLAQPSGRQQALRAAPARGDITLAARNAFGTTPINPPNKVGIARSEPSQSQTIAASPARSQAASAGCCGRSSFTGLRQQKRHVALRAVRGVFTLSSKPQRRPKTARIIEGRHPRYNREKPEKPLFFCGVRCGLTHPGPALSDHAREGPGTRGLMADAAVEGHGDDAQEQPAARRDREASSVELDEAVVLQFCSRASSAAKCSSKRMPKRRSTVARSDAAAAHDRLDQLGAQHDPPASSTRPRAIGSARVRVAVVGRQVARVLRVAAVHVADRAHAEADQVALAVRRVALEVALQRARVAARARADRSGSAKWSMPM